MTVTVTAMSPPWPLMRSRALTTGAPTGAPMESLARRLRTARSEWCHGVMKAVCGRQPGSGDADSTGSGSGSGSGSGGGGGAV